MDKACESGPTLANKMEHLLGAPERRRTILQHWKLPKIPTELGKSPKRGALELVKGPMTASEQHGLDSFSLLLLLAA